LLQLVQQLLGQANHLRQAQEELSLLAQELQLMPDLEQLLSPALESRLIMQEQQSLSLLVELLTQKQFWNPACSSYVSQQL